MSHASHADGGAGAGAGGGESRVSSADPTLDGQTDAWGDSVGAVPSDEGSDMQSSQENGADTHGAGAGGGDSVRAKPRKAGGPVVVCDTMNPVGCQTKTVHTYVDHSGQAAAMSPHALPPARLARVCSAGLGCRVVPDWHRAAGDAASRDARTVRVCVFGSISVCAHGCECACASAVVLCNEHVRPDSRWCAKVADERDLAYLLVELDVHAVDQQEVVAHAGLLKQAVAKAIGLRFETDVDHLVLAPSLGPRPADWIEVLHGSHDSICVVSTCCTFRPRRTGGVRGWVGVPALVVAGMMCVCVTACCLT